MKTIKYIKRTIALFLLLTQFYGCGVIGEQDAKWESGMFSPDGKYYAYTYSKAFITHYSKTNGVTRSSGSISFYLQIIDCAIGKGILEKPFKTDEMLRFANIKGDYTMLLCYTMGKESMYSPALFDIKSKRNY